MIVAKLVGLPKQIVKIFIGFLLLFRTIAFRSTILDLQNMEVHFRDKKIVYCSQAQAQQIIERIHCLHENQFEKIFRIFCFQDLPSVDHLNHSKEISNICII